MTSQLPFPLATYYAAKNKHDVAAMLAPFAGDAVVKDEGSEYHGTSAIRSWIEETTRNYRVAVEVKDVDGENGRMIVSGLVSGDFPGSPAMLRYAFTLAGSKISRLEIAS